MRSARLPCGTSSSSISPARYSASNTCESTWRGNEHRILRTRFAFSSAARPVSPLPALLLTMVRSRAPCAISASISSDGMPAVPKPPIITVAPSVNPGDGGGSGGNGLVDHVRAARSAGVGAPPDAIGRDRRRASGSGRRWGDSGTREARVSTRSTEAAAARGVQGDGGPRPTAAPRAGLPDASRPAFPGGAARRADPRSPRARCRRPRIPPSPARCPASTERWPLRQISTTGRFMLATFFTCPTKWGLISQSGPSFQATWWAPTGWPTKKYSISDRQSMKTADGFWCRSSCASRGFRCFMGRQSSMAAAPALWRLVRPL